ncbi:phenylalanine--tRNA ligase subunit beta [Polyrhizophydium stewartii]|uniref:phenylalanine--tRNA ligase n=1 Tax=Polyrhizophydium stewartii TaxID=2732419 RepID=A0ABR4MZB9_9FUNG
MPTVNVDTAILFDQVGRSFTDQEFEDLCFEFGIELEDVTSEQELAAKDSSAAAAAAAAAAGGKAQSNRKIYRIDIPANRYDMLCVEGIARAIRTYLELAPPPRYRVIKPANGVIHQIHVTAETAQVRPYVVGAVLRNITFDKHSYDSFIELQDKLHNNICRKRTLVAIGTHDLDTIEGPFKYDARVPKDIVFAPLNQTKVMNGDEVMTFYESDRKLNKFLHIIRDKPRYPVVLDAKDRVLSLPPIINSDHSKIKLTTKNVFIECTATDLTKAKIVLNTVVAMFSYYCKDQFSAEPVEVVYSDGTKYTYPDLSTRRVDATVDYINSHAGINPSPEELVRLISKMSLFAKLSRDAKTILVDVPPTRSDVLHACDVMEDAAIAYNFNKIVETLPKASTIAVPLPINKLSDSIRREVAYSGFTEVLTFTLCSHDENFAFLNRADTGDAVKLANPKTVEYQVVRTSLLPGLLKTVASNKHTALPLKIFEISDIVLRDESVERRARNQRQLAALYCNKSAGFELIHGLLDRIVMALDVKRTAVGIADGFYIRESENATFFPGRRADVYYQGKIIGTFGIVHPEVLAHFDITFPCSALEINVEPFL